MKKIINRASDVVTEMLDGLAYVHSDLVHRVEGFDIIARNAEKTGKVGLISGGGSGHEPSRSLLLLLLTKSSKPLRKPMRVLGSSWLSRIILVMS